MIDVRIDKSNGRGKDGRLHVYIKPDYPCFNKSRKASGFNQEDLQDSINFILIRYYQPQLIVYQINGKIIVSNHKINALSEYWRVCEIEDAGKYFSVDIVEPKNK